MKFRYFLSKLFANLFIASLIFFFFLIILEDYQPGFVSFWFDLRILLSVTVGSGVIALVLSKHSDEVNFSTKNQASI